jgi:hypothetical protein
MVVRRGEGTREWTTALERHNEWRRQKQPVMLLNCRIRSYEFRVKRGRKQDKEYIFGAR